MAFLATPPLAELLFVGSLRTAIFTSQQLAGEAGFHSNRTAVTCARRIEYLEVMSSYRQTTGDVWRMDWWIGVDAGRAVFKECPRLPSKEINVYISNQHESNC